LQKQNPGLHLDIAATDKLVDIVEEGFDSGIRFGERLPQACLQYASSRARGLRLWGAP
jgi:hypothetical protein